MWRGDWGLFALVNSPSVSEITLYYRQYVNTIVHPNSYHIDHWSQCNKVSYSKEDLLREYVILDAAFVVLKPRVNKVTVLCLIGYIEKKKKKLNLIF